ncbi:hypothetical protein [Nostoc sp.]|uniref:hypothetical protein n=1 Tax=Nostoc sp. TaxID=1180 RepID=UPI002FF5F84A
MRSLRQRQGRTRRGVCQLLTPIVELKERGVASRSDRFTSKPHHSTSELESG